LAKHNTAVNIDAVYTTRVLGPCWKKCRTTVHFFSMAHEHRWCWRYMFNVPVHTTDANVCGPCSCT